MDNYINMETIWKKVLLGWLLALSTFSATAAFNFTIDGIKYEAETPSSNSVSVIFFQTDETATYSIPETVTYSGMSFTVKRIELKINCKFRKIIIPKTIYRIRGHFSVKEIEVDSESNYFKCFDNVLYNKAQDYLIIYPDFDEREEFTIPQSVKKIMPYAFMSTQYLKKVSILHKCSLPAYSFCISHSSIETIEIDYTEEDLINNTFKPEYDNNSFYIDNTTSLNILHWRKLMIGKNICDTSFLVMETYRVDSIEVDPDNDFFTYENYMLLSKDKKKLFRVASSPLVGYSNVAIVDENYIPPETPDLIIPEGVEEISESAFRSRCNYMFSSLTFPSTIKYLPVLRNASGLTGMRFVEFKDGSELKSIPNNFMRGKNITRLKFSNNIKYIGANAFNGSGVQEVLLPENLDSIGDYAFYQSNLNNIILPRKIKKIGAGATGNVETIICQASTPPECNVISTKYINNHGETYYIHTYPFPENCFKYSTLIVPRGCKGLYETSSVWESFKKIVEGTFDAIDNIAVNPLPDEYVDVYNMQGQMLRRQVPHQSATQGLSPGIYIVGHKKVIVR